MTMNRFYASSSKAIFLLAMLTLQLASHAASAAPNSKNCTIKAPAVWSGKSVRWAGPCQQALAHGFGALRIYSAGEVTGIFYGEFRQGKAVLGVEDSGGNFTAGRIEGREFVKTDDRQTYIDAFRAAQKGALAAEAKFKAEGNVASARFYRDKASMLASQMD